MDNNKHLRNIAIPGIKERCPQGIPAPKTKARYRSSPSFPRCQEQYFQTVLQVIIKGDTPSRDEGTHPRLERDETPLLSPQSQIEGHISAMKSIIKDYNRQNKADPIRLDFGTDNILLNEGRVARGKDVGEEDLSKPFKEKLKTPLTRRIIEFAGPEYVMPANITLYDGSTDPADHLNRFSMAANSGEWCHADCSSYVPANIGRRSQGLVRESPTQ
ncbi:hypothetical protein Tco_0109956 [Tanacetum coccineum]